MIPPVQAPNWTYGGPPPGWPPDPYAAPEAYAGLVVRRMFGYFVDLIVIGLLLTAIHLVLGLLTLMTLGLLWPLHLLFFPVLVAFAYHSLQLASPYGATVGMRVFGIRAWDEATGGRISWPRALLHTLLFYASFPILAGILLLAPLFNARSRTLHDLLAGVVILRER